MPRALRGGRSCAKIDELAQEYEDRGMIADAYEDTALDFLAKSHATATSEAPAQDAKEVRKAARRLVDDRAKRVAHELVESSRHQGCPTVGETMSKTMLMKSGAGLGGQLAGRNAFLANVAESPVFEVGAATSLLGINVYVLSQQESTLGKVFFGSTTFVLGWIFLDKLSRLF